MNRIENIILRHSKRGMLKLCPYLPADFCYQAANEIASWERGNVLLTTGFYVAGYPETDGPAGTAALALVLKKMGFRPIIVTEKAYAELFTIRDLEVLPVAVSTTINDFRQLILRYHPAGMIAVERCGSNTEGDYTNMRGVSIASYTAAIDLMFQIANEYAIHTVGIGDGGNEIGMGVLAEEIESELGFKPCTVAVDYLVIATVSNWGAYGVASYLAMFAEKEIFPDYEWIAKYLAETVAIGSVDGITHERITHVDDFDESFEQEIVDALSKEIKTSISFGNKKLYGGI